MCSRTGTACTSARTKSEGGMVSQILIILLMADAAWVAWGLIRQRVMWRWICLYWIILTLKNLSDLLRL